MAYSKQAPKESDASYAARKQARVKYGRKKALRARARRLGKSDRWAWFHQG